MSDKEKEFRERLEKEKQELEYQEWKRLNDPSIIYKAPSPFKDLFIWGVAIITIIALAIMFSYASNRDSGGNRDSDEGNSGRWITKCRTYMERNPNFIDDPSTISDDLGLDKFISRKQCTDVWVDD